MYELRIPLTQGFETIVDADEYEYLSVFNWCVAIRSKTLAHAMRKHQGYTIYMHHMIIGNPLKGWYIDHINGNGLDNRKENLRVVTQRVNSLNSDRSRNAMLIEPHGNRYRVRPFVDGVRINLGSFATFEEALEIVEEYRNG